MTWKEKLAEKNLRARATLSTAEPYMGFNELIKLNGWYWEPFGSVIRVDVASPLLASVHCGDVVQHKTIRSLRLWLEQMGYEKESEPMSDNSLSAD